MQVKNMDAGPVLFDVLNVFCNFHRGVPGHGVRNIDSSHRHANLTPGIHLALKLMHPEFVRKLATPIGAKSRAQSNGGLFDAFCGGPFNGQAPKKLLVFKAFVGVAFDKDVAHVKVGRRECFDAQRGGVFEALFTTALVQSQGKEFNTRFGLDAFDQFQSVGHLRAPFWIDKGTHHHALKASIHHGVEQGEFFVQAHALALNL